MSIKIKQKQHLQCPMLIQYSSRVVLLRSISDDFTPIWKIQILFKVDKNKTQILQNKVKIFILNRLIEKKNFVIEKSKITLEDLNFEQEFNYKYFLYAEINLSTIVNGFDIFKMYKDLSLKIKQLNEKIDEVDYYEMS